MILAALTPEQTSWLVTGGGVVVFLITVAVAITALMLNLRKLKHGEPASPPPPQPFLVTLKERFVEKEVFDELKMDVHNQIKDMRSYLHDEMHGLRNEVNAVRLSATENQETISEEIGGVKELIKTEFRELDSKRSRSIGNLHEHLTAAKVEIGGVKAQATAATQEIHALRAEVNLLRTNPPQRAR